MTTLRLRRSIAGFVVGLGLCVSIATPAFAGYGNHAERATANIQTRVGIAKITIQSQADLLRSIGAAKLPTPPQP
jgi:hypothetical protein